MKSHSLALVDRQDASWESIFQKFEWHIPEYFNIAEVVCDRHADGTKQIALLYESEAGSTANFTFEDIQAQANRLANAMAEIGLERGDRVGIILPQRPETAVAHIAIYKLGAVAVPLASLFGPDALEYRLKDSGARIVISDMDNIEKIRQLRHQLPSLQEVLIVEGDARPDELDFHDVVANSSPIRETLHTKSEDPAVIIYTSGTTGHPKGVLHAHRYLLGHLPGFEMSHDFFPQDGDLAWTPADWAWIGGLMDILMPAWFYGKPVLAYRSKKFDAEACLRLIEKYRVRNVFMPPTALKLMRQVPDIKNRFDLQLRTMMCGGEALGADMLHWAKTELGVEVNEIYGQTEVNYVIGNCQAVWPAIPGSMGRAYPGHIVEVIDEEGQVLPPNQLGEIAFKPGDDAVFFLNYWKNPDATQQKFKNGWACSGDLGVKDSSGAFWFKGRKDDVIISAGYRIGPTEIEENLNQHPAVSLCAVVGVPDELRGEIVKAFVVLADGYSASPELTREIQNFVKSNLAAHEYPRSVEFVDSLPTTATGKIKRKELRER